MGMRCATLCPAVVSAPRAMAAEIDTESIAEDIAQVHRRLRRRLKGWLVRRRRLSGASRRARAVVLGQRRDGRCARGGRETPGERSRAGDACGREAQVLAARSGTSPTHGLPPMRA